jgi:hypothetical protein
VKKVIFAVSFFVMSMSGFAVQASQGPESLIDSIQIEIDGEVFAMKSCTTQADCPQPHELYQCVEGRCMGVVLQKFCQSDAECPSYHVCRSGRCIAQ